jgi:hypothetical protein
MPGKAVSRTIKFIHSYINGEFTYVAGRYPNANLRNKTYEKLEFNPPILANPFKIREDWRRHCARWALADKKTFLCTS